jgi:hypothetical protein
VSGLADPSQQGFSMLQRADPAKTTTAMNEGLAGGGVAAQGVDFPRLARSGFELSTLERSCRMALLHHAARRAWRDP